jgi:hypothetical protein
VRCLCEDETEYTNWSGITPEATFVVPSPPSPLQDLTSNEAKLNEKTSITLFPNPSDGQQLNIAVQGLGLKDTFIRIMDMNGRLISMHRMDVDTRPGFMELRFDTRLSSGLYIAQVFNDSTIISERFTVE